MPLDGHQKRALRNAAQYTAEADHKCLEMLFHIHNKINASDDLREVSIELLGLHTIAATQLGFTIGVAVAQGHSETEIKEWLSAGGLHWANTINFGDANDLDND